MTLKKCEVFSVDDLEAPCCDKCYGRKIGNNCRGRGLNVIVRLHFSYF